MNLSFAARVRAPPSTAPSGFVDPTTGLAVYLVTAVERSVLGGVAATAPDAAAIGAAWHHTPAPSAIYGQWIGVGPRIDRDQTGPVVVTTVSQPYAWDPRLLTTAADLATMQTWLTAHLNEDLALMASPDFARAALTEYNPATDRPLADWRSGAAANSPTRNGPAPGAGNATLGQVQTIVALGVAGLVLVEVVPIVGSWLKRR